ncbi:hypothetical protein C8R44DRAFT_819037 [Mycena epipterygia]|nr:hypothetical protein C8R44DRAFT_819037 [Mycena epipterygia]
MAQQSTAGLEGEYANLVQRSLIPLHVVLASLTWIIHDYFVTVEDEIRFIWSQRLSVGKIMFFWIRYYSIALLAFDAIQIYVFTIPGITSDRLCVTMDTVIHVVGAISLWSVEIVMQFRVYALFDCSKRIAIVNAVLFAGSIVGFMWILVYNHSKRADLISTAIHLPLPGCPRVQSGLEWSQFVPPTIYEGILFGFALFKTCQSLANGYLKNRKMPIYSILLRDNILYFCGIACILVFNNLMVVIRTPHNLPHIPWLSYGPFHAAVGILTTRMLMNLRKATAVDIISIDHGTSFKLGTISNSST